MGKVVFRSGSVRGLIMVCLALVVVATVVSVLAWVSLVRNPSQEFLQKTQEEYIKLSGLGVPVSNKMDDRYTDADGDLVADAPTDPTRQIDPQVLYFSYVTAEESAAFKDAFKDLMAHVARVTGKPVEYAEFESTEAQLRALRDGSLHFTAFNTGGVPIAVNVAGFVPVSLLASEENKGFYKMQIIVPADSTIKTVSDLKGKELTLTDASSNSGYKAPLVTLKEDFNMLPGRDYGIRYSGGQDASIDGIANKTYAAAAVASDVLRRAVGAGVIKEADFRIIHESSDFPSAAFGYAHNLRPELSAKLREALTNYDWKGTSVGAYFAGAGQSKFAPADFKKDWELVRRIDNGIGYAHRLPELPTTQPE